jgi:hypothetical protein
MPSVYITAAYCLIHLARLQKGEVWLPACEFKGIF